MPLIATSPALLAVWFLWCLLHSLLASRRVKRVLASRLGLAPKHYRLGYVLFSILTCAGLLGWQLRVVTPPAPAGVIWQALRLLLFAYGVYMLYAGGQAYDLREFLGLSATPAVTVTGPSHLVRDGILARVRHPWYSGGIALLVAVGETPLDRWDWRALLLAYLVLGCLIEERRLVAELGEDYRQYQREVPMLLPHLGRLDHKKSRANI